MNDIQKSCDHIIGEYSIDDESGRFSVSQKGEFEEFDIELRYGFCPLCGVNLGVVWEDLNATTPKESDQQ